MRFNRTVVTARCWTTAAGASALLLVATVANAAPGKAARKQTDTLPTPLIAPAIPVPRPNGLDDFMAAAKLVTSDPADDSDIKLNDAGAKKWNALTASERETYWPQRLDFIRQAVSADREAIARMQAGLAKECAVPNYRDYNLPFPILGRIRVLARVNRARMDLDRAEGNHASAVEAGLDTFQISAGIARHGPLINDLSAIAMRSTVRAPLVASVDELSAAQATEAGKRMDAWLATAPTPADVLEEERNTDLVLAEQVFHEIAKGAEAANAGQRKNALKLRTQREPALRQADRYMRAFIAELDKPAAARKKIAVPKIPVLGDDSVEVFAQASARMDQDEAQNRLLRCQIAIVEYSKTNGHAPAALSMLALDKRWLTDPYTGHPFVYRPTPNGYLLYCVGPNFRDDGGKLTDKTCDDIGLWDPRLTLVGGPKSVLHMAP